jgi:glycosyltransferase involved in cell wall biosynthesis
MDKAGVLLRLLFLTLANIDGISERGIYTDLLREFRDRGDDVYIVCPSQRRHGKRTELIVKDGVTILRVRTGNITKTSIVEKAVSTILIQYQFASSMKKFFGDVRFDLVSYSTPPITFDRVVNYVKTRDGCMSYLLLKDIFPQNAVDLGMIRKRSLVWRYFRSREKRLYAISDHIGCMSPANVAYVLKHNEEVPASKVEVCPNSISPKPVYDHAQTCPEIRDAYGIPRDRTLLVYGGNLGKPQGLSFLLDILDKSKDREDIFFLIVGSGTEYSHIEAHLRVGQHQNAKLLRTLPKDQYDALLAECDVGLIFLDPRFTIPNFPSRLTSYMEAAIPVIAATDTSTDIKDVLFESGSGFWVQNGDFGGFMEAVDRLSKDVVLRHGMGLRGRRYLEKHYTVSRAYEIITAHLTDINALEYRDRQHSHSNSVE